MVGVWGNAAEAPSPTVPPRTNIAGEPGQFPSELVGDRVAGRASATHMETPATHMESPSGEPGQVPSELVGEPSPPAPSPQEMG
mgnify:CR=1 FL=1